MSTVRYAAVTKHYGATVAVHEFDLEVADKEFVTLLGPSGCGKTTTLRMTAGLIQPTSGRIWFDKRDVTNLPPRSRNIGFVFQTPALFPHLSVADNIAFGLSVKGQRKSVIAERVEEMLKLVELAGYGRRLPAQLSGGQQQRVALARVLATDPTVLLFDEPLSALDKNLRETLKYSILELQRRTAKTAIYVTHDQSEAFAISDRIVVMNGGHIEQIGTQTEIYLQPRDGVRGRVHRREQRPARDRDRRRAGSRRGRGARRVGARRRPRHRHERGADAPLPWPVGPRGRRCRHRLPATRGHPGPRRGRAADGRATSSRATSSGRSSRAPPHSSGSASAAGPGGWMSAADGA